MKQGSLIIVVSGINNSLILFLKKHRHARSYGASYICNLCVLSYRQAARNA